MINSYFMMYLLNDVYYWRMMLSVYVIVMGVCMRASEKRFSVKYVCVEINIESESINLCLHIIKIKKT